jgi:hypothetical protein
MVAALGLTRDELREQQIAAAAAKAKAASTPAAQRLHVDVMRGLIAQRSSEQVRRIERARGLVRMDAHTLAAPE